MFEQSRSGITFGSEKKISHLNLFSIDFETCKKSIQKNYPKSKLELDETERRYKWGKYGIGKYIYQKEEESLKTHLSSYMGKFFPNARLEYFT